MRALVTFMSGQGFEVFNGLADELKCNLVWLLEDLAGEVADLADLSLEAEIVRRTAAEVPHD
ncbi:hypothetical protein WS72_13550 [Burkholderia savannae]|uniref:Uncharacterized protein n=1 Tax=Burkholderia savannae TaxID=1637837 RepID=A0ABR5TFJ5_9BURK|nr:hypothetical protein WS72_13550 [Burkholderia savannae]